MTDPPKSREGGTPKDAPKDTIPKETVRLHIPDLPADLHREIKIAAATRGITLKEFVIEALREKLAK